jgi:hypothetical protein
MKRVLVEGFDYMDSGLAGNAITRLDCVVAGMAGAASTATSVSPTQKIEWPIHLARRCAAM